MAQQRLFDSDPPPWELDEPEDRLAATLVLSEEPYGPFDYLVPERLRDRVQVGQRVSAPLGRGNRPVIGYCVRLGQPPVGVHRLKEIRSLVDPLPLVQPSILELTRWMADYYLCPWGQVLEAVVPAGVRTQAGTRQQTYLDVPTHVAARLSQLQLPSKQLHVLRILLQSAVPLTPRQLAELADCTLAPISQLRRKGLVREQVRRVMDPREESPAPRQSHLELNPDQQRALDAVRSVIESGQPGTLLLHGITGSGKTEVYIRAIDEVIRLGRQAIVLVPEISLTPQTCQRFRSRFDRVAVLHSMLSSGERHWHWQRISRGEVQVIVGARSAVFAPAPRLGLIVLDEEHDASFKQDKVPRYHARDVALRRSILERIPLILGSATPSLESWQRARLGQFQLVSLPCRVENRPLPDVAALDLRVEFRSRSGRGAVSRALHQSIDLALREGGQVILLLNRRGYATAIQCPACGHVVSCPDCDLPLTHHREGERAICHYCEYERPSPSRCPECRFEGIRYSGLGTQKLEREIERRFPGVPCLRVDSDTMQRPGSHEQALARFRAGEIKILLGTQMIAKGLDFPNVTLVGVINADTALHFPDFRASERTFQLVTQVAGRTGRGDKGGRVLVQTFSPEHPAIQAALRHDYLKFVEQELPTRQEYGYPPFSTLIRLIVRSERELAAEQFSEHLQERLWEASESLRADAGRAETGRAETGRAETGGAETGRAETGRAEVRGAEVRMLGPAPAPVAKLRGKYRYHVLLMGPDGAALRQIVLAATRDLKCPEDVQWVVDVDALDLL